MISLDLQFRLAWRYLFGRKLRTLLTTLAVILGVMIIFSMNGIIPTFLDSFRLGILAATSRSDLTITNTIGAPFDQEVVEDVRTTTGVMAAVGSLQRDVALPAADTLQTALGVPPANLHLVGIDPLAEPRIHPTQLLGGRFLNATDRWAMVVSDELALPSGIKVGSQLRLPSADGSVTYQVVGLVRGWAGPGSMEVYVPLQSAQAMFNLPGQINVIEGAYQEGAVPSQVVRAVLARLGSSYQAGVPDVLDSLSGSIQFAVLALNLFGALALVMGGFIIFNTFRTVVAERKRDIGMLRALGAARSTIIGVLLAESLLQGVIGTVLGMMCGYLMLMAMEMSVQPIFTAFLHGSLGRPVISLESVLLSIGLGVGVTLLAGLLPALTAARITPLEALRPETNRDPRDQYRRRTLASLALIGLGLAGIFIQDVRIAGIGVTLFLVGLMIAAPTLVRPVASVFGRLIAISFAREGVIAQGNMQRQPSRAAITASAVMISLAIVIALFGVGASIQQAFFGYLDKSMGADYLLIPQSLVLSNGNVGARSDLQAQVRAIPGIRQATSLRVTPVIVNGVQIQAVGFDPVVYSQVSGLIFSAGDPQRVYAQMQAGPAVIVNGVLANQMGLHVGDPISIQTMHGEQRFNVVGVGMDYINAKLATVYLSQAVLASEFNVSDDRLIMADRRPDANPDQVEAALRGLAAAYPAFNLYTSHTWRAVQEQAFESVLQLFDLLILVLVLPSLVALMNTLGINVLERMREIGLLRAVGASRSQVGRMILVESLLLAALGTGLGILAGILLGYVMILAINGHGFLMAYSFPYLGIAASLGIGLICGVLAALIPARQAARVDIVSALHYE